MWTAKFRLNHADCPIVSRAREHKATVLSYPSSTYSKSGVNYVSQICKIFGKEKNSLEYIYSLRKDKHLMKFEMPEQDVFAYEFKLEEGEQYAQLYFKDGLILLSPPVNSPDNHEYWEIASWNKIRIKKFHDDLTSHMDSTEMLGISNKKLRNLYFPNIMPNLSEAQRKALELAIENNYYSFPRKTDLQKLAKAANVRVATFREHLRKAENKLMPAMSKKIFNPEEF